MIELRLFGAMEISGPDRERARSVASQPRRAALLVYLAVQGLRGPIRRDQLAELFWPDADPAMARQSLRQALAFLRKALGDRAIATRGEARGEEEVAIDPIEVRCDVPAFERYLDSGDFVRASELYRGDLLSGFGATGVEGFDRWLDERRDDYRTHARRALKAQAERDDAAGNVALAIQWNRRELALEPADEDAAIRLMRRLGAAGDREGALRIYEDQRRVLQELDDEPSAELLAVAKELETRDHVGVASGTATTVITVPPESVPGPVPRSRDRSTSRRRWVPPVVAAIALIAIVTWAIPTRRTPSAEPARRTLSIVPFRVSGADQSIAYLGSGVIDLFANRLGADPGWHVESDATGGGDILSGGIVGTAQRVVIEATLRSAGDSALLVSARAEGPVDSISAIVDRVAARLLFHRAGYAPANPDQLARMPLAVLQDFLRGHDALRQGRYAVALPAFDRALSADTAFAQAALGLAAAGRRVGEWGPWQRGLVSALARRDKLGRADSLYLIALAAPHYPRVSPHVENLNAWQAFVEVAPERPEGWYELGDYLLRWGPVIGISDSRAQARAALTRALALDSGLVEPVVPLMELAISEGDTTTVRSLLDRYVANNSRVDAKDYLLWRSAIFMADSASVRRIRAALEGMSYTTLVQIAGMAQLEGVGLDDAQRVIAILGKRAVRLTEEGETKELTAFWHLNRGDPGAASRMRVGASVVSRGELRSKVIDALYAGGDTVAAQNAVRLLDTPPTDSVALSNPVRLANSRATDACTAEQWRLWRGERTNAAATIRMLRGVGRPEHRACAYLIDALDAVLNRRAGAKGKLERLDAQLRTGERPANDVMYGNLAAALLWERIGDPRRALAATRRRPYHHWQGPWYLAAFLDAERRLARTVGDKASEQHAAGHLAALRPQ